MYGICCNTESFLATKVRLDSNDKSSDILGISAMIINDLKRKRQRDYTFDWNAAFDVSLICMLWKNSQILLDVLVNFSSSFFFVRSVQRGHWCEIAIYTLSTC